MIMTLNITNILLVSMMLYMMGLVGMFLLKKNLMIMLMSMELMLLAMNFNFMMFSVYLDDMTGQIFALFILTVAAAEASIGLAILVIYYRLKGVVSMNVMNYMKG